MVQLGPDRVVLAVLRRSLSIARWPKIKASVRPLVVEEGQGHRRIIA
jgi:hypothetical protein